MSQNPDHPLARDEPAVSRPWSATAAPEDVVPLLQALIRNACVNDGTDASGNEIRNVMVLQEYLAGTSIELQVFEPLPGRGNLIATLHGSTPGAPRLGLVGHLDVVPADPSGWTRDPFAAEIVDGEVWGRGAVDMLNLTASMAVALKLLAQSGTHLRGDVLLMATADEEAGSRYGTGWLVANHPEIVLTDYAITESGGGIPVGSEDARGVTLTVGQKGGAARRVRVRGQSGHGSMPYGVRSGVTGVAEAVLAITRHRPTPEVPVDAWWADLMRALGYDEALRARLQSPDTLDDALPETGGMARILHALTHITLSPTVLKAGQKANVIPGEGVIDVDIRLLPGQTGADADRELRAALADIDAEVTIEALYEAASLSADTEDPLRAAIVATIAEVYPGATTLPLLTPGGNDSRFFLARGIPCYGFGMSSPGMDVATFRQRFHGDDERIDIASLVVCATSYVRIAEHLLGGASDADPCS